MPAPAVVLANQLVRRSPMVSAQLLMGPEAGSGWRRRGVRNDVLEIEAKLDVTGYRG